MRRWLTGGLLSALALIAVTLSAPTAAAQPAAQGRSDCGDILGGEYQAETPDADVIDLTVRYAELCRTSITALMVDLDRDGHPDIIVLASGLFGGWRTYGLVGASVVADPAANTLRWRIPLPPGTFDATAAFTLTAWAPGAPPDRVPNSGEFVWPPADSFED